MSKYICRYWECVPVEMIVETELSPEEVYDTFTNWELEDNPKVKVIEDWISHPEDSYFDDYSECVLDYNTLKILAGE